MSDYARLSVNLAPDTMDVLRGLAARHGVSITEEVRRVIAIGSFLQTEVDAGRKLAVVETSPDGTQSVREIVLL
jgi:plasmid stability protein